ncbi:MAG: YraN family protein [Bdellovibrionales bacterium]|nr:YraN family protein [Bdellovibrionales bacterium]
MNIPPPTITPASRRKIGAEFEDIATAHLQSKGYRILDRNRVYPWGEIDIVAEHHTTDMNGAKTLMLVFVEVRGRSVEHEWLSLEESILPRKAARLRRAIETYLLFYRGAAAQTRLDLVTVRGYSDEVKIDHYENYISLERARRY